MIAHQNDVTRIRRTWALAAADPGRTSSVFYGNLFRIDPSTRALFRNDMTAQGKKLTDTLGFIVDNLDSPDELLPAARDLAIRHVSYAVTADQYKSVGTALLTTFDQLLGANFSAQDRAAWANTYTTLADHMVAEAYA